MKRIYTTLFLLLTCWATLAAQKTIDIPYLQEYPQLDGQITDTCWSSVPEISDFITATPVFNEAPATETKVKIFRTEEAIYVSVYCFSKKVRADRSFRDDLGTGDYFQVGFDTWHDGQHAFVFGVTAGNAQSDSRISATGDDPDWDAIWESKATLHDDGWSAEMRIPYEALRFPRGAQRDWGIQFTRFDRKTGYVSTWSPQNPLIGDLVLQYGVLRSMGEVNQGLRVSVELQNESGFSKYDSITSDVSTISGLDARIGLNSASTLDISFVPSTGRSLSFEKSVFTGKFAYPLATPLVFSALQHRQFFREESALFSKGNLLIPDQVISGFDYIAYRKLDSLYFFGIRNIFDGRPIGAIKYNTRTKNGIALGVYGSILSKTAVVRILGTKRYRQLIDHSFNAMVAAEKTFRNNSFVNASFSKLWIGDQYVNHRSAISFRIRDKSNQYEVSGKGLYAPTKEQKTFPGPNPEVSDVTAQIRVAKANGALQWRIGIDRLSPNITPISEQLLPTSQKIIGSSFDLEVSYQDFKRSKHYLNIRYYANVLGYQFKDQEDYNAQYIGAGCVVLDNHFRKWGLGFSSKINDSFRFLSTSFDAFIRSRTNQFIAPHVSFESDARKKITFGFNVKKVWFFGDEVAKVDYHIHGNWRIHRKYNINFMSTNTPNGTSLGQPFFSDVNGYWSYPLFQTQLRQSILAFSMMPSPKLNLTIFGMHNFYQYFDAKAIRPSTLGIYSINYSFVVPNRPNEYNQGCGGNIAYNFKGVGLVRLNHTRYGYGKNSNDLFATSSRRKHSTSLSLIWFNPIKKQKYKQNTF